MSTMRLGLVALSISCALGLEMLMAALALPFSVAGDTASFRTTEPIFSIAHVVSRKCVSVFAVLLTGIREPALKIDDLRNRSQVVGIDAGAVAALVVDNETVWDVATGASVRKTMRHLLVISTGGVSASVGIGVPGALVDVPRPRPTSLRSVLGTHGHKARVEVHPLHNRKDTRIVRHYWSGYVMGDILP